MTSGYDTKFELDNACPVFAAAMPHLLRAYGRGAEADARRTAALGPLVQALRNSRSDTAGAERSGFAMADLARRWAARALDAAGLPSLAAELRDCEAIVDARTAEAAERVAAAVTPTPRAGELSAGAAARAARCAAWAAAAYAPHAVHAIRNAAWAAEHAADAAMHAAEAVGLAAKFAGTDWPHADKSARTDLDAFDMCVSELLALVQRETARGA